jgi:hypothetical protein
MILEHREFNWSRQPFQFSNSSFSSPNLTSGSLLAQMNEFPSGQEKVSVEIGSILTISAERSNAIANLSPASTSLLVVGDSGVGILRHIRFVNHETRPKIFGCQNDHVL